MPIVLGTFTYSWKKCIGLSRRLLIFIDAPNELFSLVAMNARQYSLPHDEAVN